MIAYPPAPRRGSIVGRILTSIVTTLLVASILLNFYLGAIFISMSSGPSEIAYTPGDAAHRIVILPIEGGINDDMAQFVRKALLSLRETPPAAIVLRVDSGGGGVSASDQIWHYLSQYKQDHPDLPIVASFGSVAASGGYYVSADADFIMAEATCITGSIGVMAPYMTFDQLLEKIGVTPEVLVATQSPEKDVANNLFRAWTDEDRQVVRVLLDNAYERFVEVVALGRSDELTAERVKELATGRVFTATQAVDAKLVDGIGYLDQAIDKAKELAAIPANVTPKVTIIREPRGFGVLGLLGSRKSADLSSITAEQLQSWIRELRVPRPAYEVSYP
jgi:protease-4